ncbi:uncharacterized protein RHOBADRAFT_43600 [Rhodotorula graminis WP1]|uniref:DNA sliding clamp PCNA n=1 Tax=Rhodotorula graminis (strain WP1) TaxID=578459 RepID=A0A194S3M6_RHOGW|nr:uncharacterized protein RHOBADRAFT_43600 [Rhodotorula graminis WP1]KPV75110.1 hypothetical protein RHOBADRAFT_43600 [Rhodotorula graminis WP1]
MSRSRATASRSATTHLDASAPPRDPKQALRRGCSAPRSLSSPSQVEARLEEADLLKKVLDAVKELVTDANFDCSDEGIKLQAMDNSHVALVSLNLIKSGFSQYRCDRDMSLGMSLTSLQKIVKCAANTDTVTLRADESQDVLALLFEAKKTDRVGEYEMKLMDIDQEHLGIPDTVYDAEIDLPSGEFARIIRDLKELGESVKIEVSKDGVRFSSEGDIGNASVTLKPTDRRGKEAASDSDEDESEAEGSDDEDKSDEEEEEEEEEEEPKEEDEDVQIADGSQEDQKPTVAASGDEDEDGDASSPKKKRAVADSEDENDDEDQPSAKKVKGEKGAAVKKEKDAAAAKKEKEKEKKKKAAEKDKAKRQKEKEKKAEKKKAEKKKAVAKKGKAKKEDEDQKMDVKINLQQAVSLTFSIKYLSNFAKSTPLSDRVQLHMSNEVPLLVQYSFDAGNVRYYLAPKIADE